MVMTMEDKKKCAALYAAFQANIQNLFDGTKKQGICLLK